MSSSITIIKPDRDDRDYSYFVLENGLSVLLCSDPKAEILQSAAAMDVGVGSMQNPRDTQGLAHFLEHMLFLGTEKYPDENSYQVYLEQHGGQSNAFTYHEDTNYYFDVTPDHLYGALDRFAQFFIAPLFTQSATDREINAVQSEHKMYLTNDSYRLNGLRSATANPNHPYSMFSTGSLETLQRDDIRDRLIDFHAKYYSANIMKLVVLGKESIDTLKSWVTELFSPVTNKNVIVPHAYSLDMYLPEQLAMEFKFVPVVDKKQLMFEWLTTPLLPHWRSRPAHYLSHLLGHEGDGSILAWLKAKNWANSLVCGAESSFNFDNLYIDIELTDSGFEHIEDIVTGVYQYLAMLKNDGIQQWVYDELRQLGEIDFRFLKKKEPINYVSALAFDLHRFPPENILDHSYIMTEYRPDLIRDILGCISPEKMRVYIGSKTFEGKTDRVAKYHETPFSQSSISTEFLQSLTAPPHSTDLFLPKPNPFIPEDFSQHAPSKDDQREVPFYVDLPHARLWYYYDSVYNEQSAYFYLLFISPHTRSTPKHAALTNLYTYMVEEALNTFSYDAHVAGLKYSLNLCLEGFELRIGGYNDKLPILLNKISQELGSQKLNAKDFDRMKSKLEQYYEKILKKQPYHLTLFRSNYLIEKDRLLIDDCLAATKSLTFDDLAEHTSSIFSALQLELQAFSCGNLSLEESKDLISSVWTNLNAQPCPPESLPSNALGRIPAKAAILNRLYVHNSLDENSAVLNNYWLPEFTYSLASKIYLLERIASAHCFDVLRTNQQLGYVVFAGIIPAKFIQKLISVAREQYDHLKFTVGVQSATHDVVDVDEAIEGWFTTFRSHLEALPEETFESTKTAIILNFLEKEKQLKTLAARFWSQASFPRTCRFNEPSELAEAVKPLTKPDLLALFDEYLSADAPERRKFSIQYVKTSDSLERLASKDKMSYTHVIEDTAEFKRAQEYYPPLTISPAMQ